MVLNGIDLQVKEGEVVAIIGPSGSGKTTFLRCLNFLEEPSSGRIKVGDIEIDGSRPLNQQQSLVRRLRQHVGFVFQNFNLFPPIAPRWKNVIEGPLVVKKRSHAPKPLPWVKKAVGQGRSGGQGRRLPATSVRRSATACGDCPSVGDGTGSDPVR